MTWEEWKLEFKHQDTQRSRVVFMLSAILAGLVCAGLIIGAMFIHPYFGFVVFLVVIGVFLYFDIDRRAIIEKTFKFKCGHILTFRAVDELLEGMERRGDSKYEHCPLCKGEFPVSILVRKPKDKYWTRVPAHALTYGYGISLRDYNESEPIPVRENGDYSDYDRNGRRKKKNGH